MCLPACWLPLWLQGVAKFYIFRRVEANRVVATGFRRPWGRAGGRWGGKGHNSGSGCFLCIGSWVQRLIHLVWVMFPFLCHQRRPYFCSVATVRVMLSVQPLILFWASKYNILLLFSPSMAVVTSPTQTRLLQPWFQEWPGKWGTLSLLYFFWFSMIWMKSFSFLLSP